MVKEMQYIYCSILKCGGTIFFSKGPEENEVNIALVENFGTSDAFLGLSGKLIPDESADDGV